MRIRLAATALLVAATPAGAAELDVRAACPRPADAAALARFGGVFTGDLDGDPGRERVFVVGAPRAPGRCGLFLVVRDGRTARAIRVPPFVPGAAWLSLRRGLPEITGLFRIDASRRLDVVVQVDRGLTRAEYVLYRFRGGRLLRPRFQALPRNRLSWSATGPRRGVFDCAPTGSGRLSQFEAELEPSGFWEFRGETFCSRDARFVSVEAFSVVVGPDDAPARFRAWPTRPLVSCD